MHERQFGGFFPTQADFAYRMLACLTKTVGMLSEHDFMQLFDFPRRRKVLARFRKVVFRGYIQMFMNPPRITRLRGLSFQAKRNYLRQAKDARCRGWKTPYEVYKGAFTQRIDRETFIFWWGYLNDTEKVIFLDACAQKIQEACHHLWLNGAGENARICVKMADGADSGNYFEF